MFYWLVASADWIDPTCRIMSGVLLPYDVSPSFLLYVLVCTYLLCASPAVFSYSRVDLTRPVDDFYGLPGNYTSRLDFYVHSYHLMRSSRHRNTTKFSRCTPDNPCLRVSDVFPFRNNCRPGHLVSIYLVADPDLECRVDFGEPVMQYLHTRYFCTVVYRALLLVGCNTTTVAMPRDNPIAIGAGQLIIKFHSLRFIVPGSSSENSYRLSLSGHDLTVVFQNCHFLALAPDARAVFVTRVVTQHGQEQPFPLLQFTMINCTVKVLKPDEGVSITSKQGFFSVSSGPSALINISFSQFYGLYALHIKCDAGNEIPVLRRVRHSPVQVCKVFISHCDFIDTRGDHAARFDHVISEHFTTHAFVEMSNVRVVNGSFYESPLSYDLFHNIRMANCSFLDLTCITEWCIRGIHSGWARSQKNNSLGGKPLDKYFRIVPIELGFHCTNCVFGGQPYLKPKAAIDFATSPYCLTPFVKLMTSGMIDELPNQLAARFTNLVMHDTYNPTASTGLLCASYTDIVIDGMTDIR